MLGLSPLACKPLRMQWYAAWRVALRGWGSGGEGFHDIESPRSPLDTIAVVRAEGEVGVQRHTQNFRGSVQRSHSIATFVRMRGQGHILWLGEVKRSSPCFVNLSCA